MRNFAAAGGAPLGNGELSNLLTAFSALQGRERQEAIACYLSASEGSSTLLQVPPMIANLGNGALYIVCWLLGTGFADDPQQAARATYEYGNHFLLVAGLLNYAVMLDAFDIAAGRKS